MDETEAPTQVQDAPGQEGFRGAAEAAEEPVQAPPTKEGEERVEVKEEPTGPKTWEDFEQTEGFTDLASTKRAAWLEEAKPEIFREAKSAAMREFDPHVQRQEAHLRDIAEQGQRIARAMRQAVQAEQLDANRLQDIIDDNRGFLEAVNTSMYNTGQDAALRKLAAESGDAHLLSDVYIRLRNDPNMTEQGFAREYLDRLTEARMRDRIKEERERAIKPKDEEIASLKAQLNDFKAKANKGEGPASLPGSTGGGKSPADAWAEAGFPETGPLKEAYQASLRSEAI